MMPLTMAKAGETVTIKKITGKDEIRLHLAELGFVVDSEVTVVDHSGQGEPHRAGQDHGKPYHDWLNSAQALFGSCSETGIVSL